MTVDYPQLLLGLLLLWFPRQWMRLGRSVRRRRRTAAPTPRSVEPWLRREPGDPRIGFRAEFRKPRNYFDLLRGLVGGLAIMGSPHIASSITAEGAAAPLSPLALLAVNLGILYVGLLIQTIRFERHHLTFFAPVFFLAGLSLSLGSSWAALFAFILIWAVNPMLGSAMVFLIVYGVVLCVFGLLLTGLGNRLPVAALGLCWLPVLLSLLTRRPLVTFSRKPGQPHSTGH